MLTAIGAPVKADLLGVTEREAFPGVCRRGQRALRDRQSDLQRRGHPVTGNIEDTQFKDLERVMAVDYWGVVNGTKILALLTEPWVGSGARWVDVHRARAWPGR